MRWISVTESWPPEEEFVLWYCPVAHIPVFMAQLHTGYLIACYGDSFGIPKFDDCTHWMPLPKPPEEL